MGKIIVGIVVAIVVIGGGYWLYTSSQNTGVTDTQTSDMDMDMTGVDTSGTNTTGTTDTTGSTDTGTAPMSATVSYDGNSFSPSTVTIAKGGSVTFTSTGSNMWVASNPHPEHTTYDGTTRSVHCASGYKGAAPFDQCTTGSSYTFTFTKSGSWGYHNHMNPGASGTVIVQ